MMRANLVLGWLPTAFIFAAAGVGGEQPALVSAFLLSSLLTGAVSTFAMLLFVQRLRSILTSGVASLSPQQRAERTAVMDKMALMARRVFSVTLQQLPVLVAFAFWPWLRARLAYFCPIMQMGGCSSALPILASLLAGRVKAAPAHALAAASAAAPAASAAAAGVSQLPVANGAGQPSNKRAHVHAVDASLKLHSVDAKSRVSEAAAA